MTGRPSGEETSNFDMDISDDSNHSSLGYKLSRVLLVRMNDSLLSVNDDLQS